MAHSLKAEEIILLPGMRQDIANSMAPPGTLATAVNVRYGKAGAISVRRGTTAVSSATHGTQHEIQNSGGLSFLSTAGGLAMLGTAQGKIFTLDSLGQFNFAGRFSSCLPVKRRAGLVSEFEDGYAQAKYGVASNSAGYVLTVSGIGSSGSGYTTWVSLDANDGTRIGLFSVAGGQKCQAISLPSGAFVVVSQSGTTLSATYVTIASGVVTTSSGTIGTLNNSAQYWDTAPGSSATYYMIFQDGAANLAVNEYTTASFAAVATRKNITVTGNPSSSIWCDTTNSRLWMSWHDNPGVTGAVTVLATGLTGTNLCAATVLVSHINSRHAVFGPAVSGSGSAFFTYNSSFTGAETVPRITYGNLTIPANPADPASSTSADIHRAVAISKPDTLQRSWIFSKVDPQPDPTFSSGDTVVERVLLIRFDSVNLDGASIELSCDEFDTDNASGYPTIDMISFAWSQSGLCTFAVPRRLRNGGAFNGLYSLDVYQYESIERHPWRSTANMGQTLVVAGQPVESPANSAGTAGGSTIAGGSAEIGFQSAPQIIDVTEGTTGSMTLLGTYSYISVVEWIDAFGRRHRSAPSAPVEITLTGANDSVDLVLVAPDYGQRFDPSLLSYPVHHVYRTEAGGEVHYRVTPGNDAPRVEASSSLSTFTDTFSDANLILYGEALYVDAALCDYNLAPSCRFIWRDERRVYFGGLWETDQIHASLDIIPEQPIESSDFAGLNGPAFRILVGEDVTGGAYQDGTNYVFSRRAIYAFSGDGPDRQGSGDFSRPRVLTRETGCIDYRSVLATSRGIFFQSERGIELIERGAGKIVFVGSGIQDLLATYSTCLGATIHSDASSRTARFLLSTGAASIVAVYDLDLGAWSYDEYPVVLTTIGEWPSGTALGKSDQTGATCALLETKNSSTHLDDATVVTLSLQTHVIRPWGALGMGRINQAQLLFSNTNTNDTLAFNATPDVGSSITGGPWTFAGAAGWDNREMTTTREMTSAYFSITYTRNAGTRVPSIHAIMLEHQPLPGAKRNPASSQ